MGSLRYKALLFVALLALATSCAPINQGVAFPKARVKETKLVALDPFADEVRVGLLLELNNPNPFPLPLLESELTGRLGTMRAAATLPALTLPAGGSRETWVELRGSLTGALDTAVRLVRGEELPLELSGRLAAEVAGRKLYLGPKTLLRERVRFSLSILPPKIEPLAFKARLSGTELLFSVRYRAKNQTPVGYLAQGELAAKVGGYALGQVPLSLKLPPLGESEGELVLRVSLFSLPAAITRALEGSPVELSGHLKVAIPGVYEALYPIRLVGVLR